MNKVLNRCFCICASALLLLPACGKSDNAELNETVARSQATAAIQAVSGLQNNKGQAAAFGLIALGTSAQGILVADGKQKRSAPLALDLDRLRATEGEGCECDENSCTFDDCGSGGFKINGKIKWDENSMECDYKASGALQGMEWDFSIDANLKYSETSLDGDINSQGSVKGNIQGHSLDASWSTSLVFNEIKFSSGEPTSGTMSVKSEYKTEDQDLRGSGDIDFGK